MINNRHVEIIKSKTKVIRSFVPFCLCITILECASISYSQDTSKIYIANDDHTDLFWTADEATYKQAFLKMLDYYLDLADSTQNNKPEFQSRWNCDGSYWMWVYQKNKTASQFQRLIDRIKDGHVSVPLNALVVCLGGAPAEAVIRGMYYPGKIEREFGVNFDLAISMENMTLPYGLSALWAGAGAKYSWKGVCACDTRVSLLGHRDHEIYWLRGPDNSKILMKWNSLLGSNTSLGGYAEARNPAEVIDFISTDSTFKSLYPYNIAGAFGNGWDDLETLTDEFVKVAETKSDSVRKIIVSNQEDFFRDFESKYGASLPDVSESYGNEWDLYCASLAEESARVKRSVEKLRSAEALSVLIALVKPGFLTGRETARDQAWMDLGLYWEHNFGMVGKGDSLINERINWQKRLASEIESYVDGLYTDAVNEFGKLIKNNDGASRFFVFNQLSWERTDYADILYEGSFPVKVIDVSTGDEVPSQKIVLNGKTYLRILASNIPSVGYKVYEIIHSTGNVFPDAAVVSDNTIENNYYKLTLAVNGAIKSLIDKNTNKEIARGIKGRYLNDIGSSSGNIQIENIGPVSVTLRTDAPQPLNHTTKVTLYNNVNRIDIQNEITQNFSDAYTWSFNFNFNNPTTWHEEVGAVIEAKLKSEGGFYADNNARYDWLTLNHFADMSDGTEGITLSNADCYFMKLGDSRPDLLDEVTPSIEVLAGGNVAAYGGLPDQGGDQYFLQRFALQTHNEFNAVNSMKFSLEHQNPFVTGMITGGETYPDSLFSF